MIRKLTGFTVVALLAAFSLSAQTADEVVSKYLAARGGVDKIKSVKSERITGTISFGADTEGPFLVERQRPLKMYMQMSVSGQTFIRSYDGKASGWVYNPFTPNPAVQPMTDSDIRNIGDEADFDGPFVDYKAKGNQIDFVDKEEVLGTSAYKLKLTNKLGIVSFFYFDAATNLLLKWEGDRIIDNKSFPWETLFHDFREVNGLKYPFLIDSDSPGTDLHQRITADKIEVNIPIDAARFGKPTPPTPPSAPAAPASPAEPASPNPPASPQKPGSN